MDCKRYFKTDYRGGVIMVFKILVTILDLGMCCVTGYTAGKYRMDKDIKNGSFGIMILMIANLALIWR